MSEPLEPMAAFFDRRVNIYDEHMRQEIERAEEFYPETAKWIPVGAESLLDLGCGTGLELEEIYRRNPEIAVTGIDLSAGMLARLREKFADKGDSLRLIQGSYLEVELGKEAFDAAVSVETMHHFTHGEKRPLYRRIWQALKPGGIYVETDYTAPCQEYEEHFFAEYERLRAEQGRGEGAFHYDRPCTVEHQIQFLREAGFVRVGLRWHIGGTSILTAEKDG